MLKGEKYLLYGQDFLTVFFAVDLFKKWGIAVTTNDEEVRHVYRLYVQKMHPDRVGNTKESQDAFCRLQDEYALLKTRPKRQAYLNDLQSSTPPPPAEVVSVEEPEEKTRIMTGGSVVPPSPLKVTVPVPLSLASSGGRMQIIVSAAKPCSCGRRKSCRACKGTGQVWHDKKVRVSFGSGTKDGAELLINGEGHQGTFQNGDLYVTLQWADSFGWTWNKVSSRLERLFVVPPFMVRSCSLVTKMPNGTIKKITFRNAKKSLSSEKIYFWVPTQDGFKKGFVIVKPSWLGISGFFSQIGLRLKMSMNKDKG